MKDADERRDPIPEEFGSEEEASAFWDTHSLAAYEDSLEAVDVDIGKRHFEIEVDEKVFLGVTEQAKKKHQSVKDLASQILAEKLATA